ncbi:hypothetical protein B0H13DRAFT_2341147 [Mycena leptocephala]|nr:hypothetical protein B0H13DRAFT_2341147 [Mycena leptocephala]
MKKVSVSDAPLTPPGVKGVTWRHLASLSLCPAEPARPPDAIATASPLASPRILPSRPLPPRKAAHRSNGATPSVSPCSKTTPEQFIRRQLLVFLFTPATPPSPSDDPLLFVPSSYTNMPGFGLFPETERRSPNGYLFPAPIIESPHITRRISTSGCGILLQSIEMRSHPTLQPPRGIIHQSLPRSSAPIHGNAVPSQPSRQY